MLGGGIVNKDNLKSNENVQEEIVEIEINQLENFPNHPFKVLDEGLEELQMSIKESGITTPLIVRKLENGNYELVSGHRRKRACELLGITKLPCIVRNLTRDEAIIQMVNTNIQRESILPSEKAFAYKMKYEAIKHQGKRNDLTSTQLGSKLRTNEEMGKDIGESREQIRRYIRLTELITELLDMVDIDRIAFNTAVELSYLTKEEQENLLETIEIEERTPSYAQALKMKELSKSGELDMDMIFKIMVQPKGNEQEQLKFKVNDLKSYFPNNYTIKQMENVIQKLLQSYQKQWQQKIKNRDSR